MPHIIGETIRHRLAPALVASCLAVGPLAGPALAQQKGAEDHPVQPGGEGEGGLEGLTGEASRPLQVTGFAVGNYRYAGRTGDNSFAASKLALSVFRELSDQLWIFGQLTTSLARPEGGASAGEEVSTEIEIDNLLVNFTPPGASDVSLSFGKFDVPLGFERDDEPLNLQATNGLAFELARPAKMVGLVGRWTVSPQVEITGMVGNGWDSQLDPNHGKTAGARFGWTPSAEASFGLGGLFGPEGDQGDTHDRYLTTFDYALQPAEGWIVAGEADYGGDRNVLPDGSDAAWYGVSTTLFRRFARRVGGALRAEVFRDRDGVRTGVRQTLESLTLTPIYFLGTGREGIFANVEHTTFRIPRFQVRGGLRFDHSNRPVFETTGDPGSWDVRYVLQLVATF